MNIISTETARKLKAIWSERPIPPLSYATVSDFCEYADVCTELFGGCQDLKDAQRPWVIKAILATVPPGASLVEIGGGEPTVAQALVDLGYRVTVVDPYDGSGNGPVEYDRYCLQYPQVRLVRSLFTAECPFPDASFDCVYSVSVIEHIPLEKLSELFFAMEKFVKPGGVSIHCIDVVLRGWEADKHYKTAREIVRLQQNLTEAAELPESLDYDKLLVRMEADLETFLLSAHGHNVRRNQRPYDNFLFRKVASVQVYGRICNRVDRASEAERQQSALKLANDFKKLQDTSIRKSFKSRLVAAFPWFKGRKLRRLCRQIERSGLFDPAYYCSQLPARFKVNNPLVHYLRIGWKAGLSPHRLFNVAWYQQSYARKLKGREPLTDFLQGGWKKKRRPHPLFDVEWYVQRYPESAEKDRNPLSDYIRYAVRKKRWPQPLFDGAWYVNQYGAQLAPAQTPLEHYLEGKNPLKCRPNPLLDTKWYVKQYFGSSKPDINPLLHYLEVGAKCGLEPNPLFDPSWYVHEYPSVAKSGMNPLAHYIHAGAAKNFKPCPLFESGWYARQYQNFIKDKVNPLAHYLIHGLSLGCKPNPQLDTVWYLESSANALTSTTAIAAEYLSAQFQINATLKMHEKLEKDAHIMQTIEPWFDREFYLTNNPDVANAGKDPLEHYHFFGEREGRKPRVNFDPAYYLSANCDVRLIDMNGAGHPFYHYVIKGVKEGRSGTGFLDPICIKESSSPLSPAESLVGIAVHLFYPDVWQKIQRVISCFPDRTRLYLSLVEGHSDHMRHAILEEYPTARVKIVKNRGRDVMPFLTQLSQMLDDGVTSALKIHSKKTVTHAPGFGDVWRDSLYEDLAPTDGHVRTLISLFQTDPQAGVLIPEDHYSSLLRQLKNNRPGLIRLATALDTQLEEERMGKTPFPAGTMFWFRPTALAGLTRLNLQISDFPEEAGQLDGTLAHAVERIVSVAAQTAGYHTIAYRWKARHSPADLLPQTHT